MADLPVKGSYVVRGCLLQYGSYAKVKNKHRQVVVILGILC